jgi:hypothetical protein
MVLLENVRLGRKWMLLYIISVVLVFFVGAIRFSITTFSITALSITTFSMKLNKIQHNGACAVMLSVINTECWYAECFKKAFYAECHYAECRSALFVCCINSTSRPSQG